MVEGLVTTLQSRRRFLWLAGAAAVATSARKSHAEQDADAPVGSQTVSARAVEFVPESIRASVSGPWGIVSNVTRPIQIVTSDIIVS
jgi:hypothetical protein